VGTLGVGREEWWGEECWEGRGGKGREERVRVL